MLEGPLKSWICSFLGQYVESESVHVSTKLWKASERLKLENLTLKKTLIPAWLPFRLKAGFIGQFEADLPLSAIFGSGAAKIKFIDVLLVLAPLQHDAAEQRDEETALIEQKLAHLEQDLVDRWHGPRVPEYEVPHDTEGYFGVDGWLGRTITKLIDNLQIDVRNLHIRIEGQWFPATPPSTPPRSRVSPPSSQGSTASDTSAAGTKFAAGISLSALSAVTTPSNWRIDGFDDKTEATTKSPGPAEAQSHLVFKLINALELSAYVDPVALHFIHSRIHPRVLQSTLARLKEMGAKTTRADWWKADESVHAHRFLIAPIAVALKLTMNTAAQHADTDEPRYDAAFHLSKLTSAIDEEQLSVLNLIIDAYCRHEEWRVKVSDRLREEELAAARDAEHLDQVVTEYAALWKQVERMKKDGIEHTKQSPSWDKLTVIERTLPFEFIVSLRNRVAMEPVVESGERGSYGNLLHEMGDAMGIPLPEISVAFAAGPTGLQFDLSAESSVVVSRKADNSQASKKDAIRPGLLLVNVNGSPLESLFRFKNGLDVQLQLDNMPGNKLLTFRHPLVKPADVTPTRVVAKIALTSDDLIFRLVRARKKTVLAKISLDQPTVNIHGFGPDLFSFHRYEVGASDFYIQNSAIDEEGSSYCIASSVCKASRIHRVESTPPVFRLEMDYLHDSHPDALPSNVSTYGSKISIRIGDSVVVVEEKKMTRLMVEWYDFCSAISDQYGDVPGLFPPMAGSQLGNSMSLTSSGITAESIGVNEMEAPVTTSSYSYDFKIDRVVVFVSAAIKTQHDRASVEAQPSYRSLLKQLVSKDSSLAQPVQPDWARATQAIVLMQRYIRGWLVRRKRMVRIALNRSRWANYQSGEMMGWLYTRDDSLAFRRWRRSWCHLDEDAVLSVHLDGSGSDLLDEFSVTGCNVTLVPNAPKGPWGARKSSCILELRSAATGTIRKVFSSDILEDLEKWRSCFEAGIRNAAKREVYDRDRSESVMTDASTDPRDHEAAFQDGSPIHSSSAAETKTVMATAETLLLGGFSDTYQPSFVLHAQKTSWISIHASALHFLTDVHRVSEPEQSAFILYTAVQYLSITDHRKVSNHGLLHIGDEFLGLKNGVLAPARIRSDRLMNGPFLALNLSYRGANVHPSCFVSKEGLHADMNVSGWFLPLNLYDVIFEVLAVVSVLWTDPSGSTMSPEVSPTTEAWFQVSSLDVQIRAPIIEAYLEDSHCVAKLSLEKSVFGFKADSGMEKAKIHLGPTALFVLTDEVALRLAQVEKLWFDYELRVNKATVTDPQSTSCELCMVENSKRPICHRSMYLVLGQVKLEADRRLELLFALIEALTSSGDDPTESQADVSTQFGSEHEAKHGSDEENHRGGTFRDTFDVHPISIDCMPTERLQSMQFTLDDQDMRPMYDHFGSQYPGTAASPTGRSRFSSATTGNNWHSQENWPDRVVRTKSTLSTWIPLLNYQAYIGILCTDGSGRSRTLFQLRIRVGRVHDRLSVSCSSVVFEVIKRSLSVVALDTYIPVMNLSINDMKALVLTRTEFSLDAEVDASVEICARYYNSALADWEPFIEPWRGYARIKSDEVESGTSVQLSAMQRLNVNVTEALVRLLSSVAKNRKKQVLCIEKRTPAAVAADGEAKKEDGRVCVLNNLGVPIRLANLNTSHSGTLHVEVRDGWSFPGYTRFHDVRVEVVLLPWWHPRESKRVESIRHKFSLPYGGAQSGVTPILRLDVSSFGTGKRNFVFDQISNRYVEVEDDADLEEQTTTLSQHKSVPSLSQMRREESNTTAKPRWGSIGTAEINLVGSVMGSLGSRGTKMSRWYRLHDSRGHVTGEIFVALEFVPHAYAFNLPEQKCAEPDQVKDGQFLVFDPLKILTKEPKGSSHRSRHRPASSKQIILSHGLRGSYVPPLALEVIIGSTKCSLLCPLRRAGKFLIQGDKVLAEVKVAQRDESRRVLLLSSPVQIKNDTSIEMELWTSLTKIPVGESGTFDEPARLTLMPTSNKISIPLSAMFGDEKQSVIVKVDGCKPTVIANLGDLVAGSTIIPLEPESGSVSGFCLFVSVNSFMRKVYREEHQDVVTRGGTSATSDAESQSYATKYQIGLHSCLVFENTLPVRVQFKLIVPQAGVAGNECKLRSGTLAPGEDVHLHEFHADAQLKLRLPEMDSMWCRSIDLGDCIYREGMDKSVRSMLGAKCQWTPVLEFFPSLAGSSVVFKEDDIDSKKVVARLDYTTADDGSPRVVLYASLWLYNQSHISTLLFRCSDDVCRQIVHVPQIVPQRPVPRIMDCPSQTFEISTIVDHEVSKWSDRIHSAVVGIQAPISLKFGGQLGPKTRNEIGISIQRPLGQFHRTTQVVVTSRFVIVNKTKTVFKVCSHGRDTDNVLEIPAAAGTPSCVPFDYDIGSTGANRCIYIRMDHQGAEWSGPFTIEDENEFPLRLNGQVEAGWNDIDRDGRFSLPTGFLRCEAKMNRVRVRIHSVASTMVVTFMRDDPPMFLIRNESSLDLFVHQHKCSDELVIVRSKEFVPFAWTKPDGARRVACRVGAPGHNYPHGFGSGVYDFNNLDRERGIDELKFWLFGNQLRRITADIAVEESSRVLVFKDQNSEHAPSYVLEVKIIAARFFHELSAKDEPTAEIVVETDNHQPVTIESKELKTAHVYRFDSDTELSCEARPKRLVLSLFQHSRPPVRTNGAAIDIGNDVFLDSTIANDGVIQPSSPMAGGDESGPFEMMKTPLGSPSRPAMPSDTSLNRRAPFYRFDSESALSGPVHLSDVELVSDSDVTSNQSEMAGHVGEERRDAAGIVEIKIPRKAWAKFGVGVRRSIAWSHNNMGQALLSLGRLEGHWWEMRDPESGELVGEVQVALKFRTTVRDLVHPANLFNVSVQIPSVGFSFLHNANSNLVEVAYLSMQRLGLVYSCVGDSSEIAFSLGNVQVDNQMDEEVMLGPKVHRVKEGVSVRLRDRWKSFRNYRYRGIYEQLDTTNCSFIQFRMLWNSRCKAGDIVHYELVEFIMQELEISTDEKFVVNLITVFQGLGSLTSQHTFDEIVDTRCDFVGGGTATEERGPDNDGIYIEELAIEAIRIKFSMELNGGRHLKTLGPSGRRLAVYLPESNVKDFRLYFSTVTYTHLYESKANVVQKVSRRYQQQAVILVLRGLHTVSVYANPFRIAYRFGHGFLEVVRLPARGLASGSPVELITGAYLGVRSLAMNTISAGYEIVAGATGILSAVIAPFLPDSRRRAFEEDMLGFQRAVIEEVDSFDAAEERTMTKLIVRKPRVFDAHGVGLLTAYGPGSVPMEEQDRIDHRAVVLLQQWWRRRRRANILYAEALRLRPPVPEHPPASGLMSRLECAVM